MWDSGRQHDRTPEKLKGGDWPTLTESKQEVRKKTTGKRKPVVGKYEPTKEGEAGQPAGEGEKKMVRSI